MRILIVSRSNSSNYRVISEECPKELTISTPDTNNSKTHNKEIVLQNQKNIKVNPHSTKSVSKIQGNFS
jgi:hypothetical protein